VHIFRTTPTHLIQSSFPEIEAGIRSFLGRAVFGGALSDLEWEIVQLPYGFGGWNVTPLEILAPCAHLASLLANRDAVLELRPLSRERYEAKVQAAAALLKTICPNANLPELTPKTKQRDLVNACMEARAKELMLKLDERTQALLRGQSQEHASMWKHAAHTAEMFIPGDLFQIMARYSIGRKMFPTSETCPACRKAELDPFGDHAIICMPYGDVVHRHNDLYRPLISDARDGMISLIVEDTIVKSPTSTYRADFLFPRGIPGFTDEATAFDLTVSCPLNKTILPRAAWKDLATAEAAEQRKEKEQEKELKELHFDFVALPFETTGGHTPQVATLVHYIAHQKELMTGIPFSENVTRLWELLSVTLQRANAFAIKRRFMQLKDYCDDALLPQGAM
jgi:hypothetical protein